MCVCVDAMTNEEEKTQTFDAKKTYEVMGVYDVCVCVCACGYGCHDK